MDDHFKAQLQELLKSNNKIAAIKLYKETTKKSLRESKEDVEFLEEQLKRNSFDSYSDQKNYSQELPKDTHIDPIIQQKDSNGYIWRIATIIVLIICGYLLFTKYF